MNQPRAAVWNGPGELQVERRPAPDRPAGWVLVRPDRVGLCGTDLAIVGGSHSRARPPLVLGHEITGTIATPSAHAPTVGSRVVVNPTLSCGTCWPCRHQLSHTCVRLQLIGIDVDGGLSELVAVPASSLVIVGPSVAADEAVLAEPLAVAVHAVDRGDVSSGDTVLVVGAGPIGILIGLVAQSRGCRILVSEPNPVRHQLASVLGFVALPVGQPLVEAVRAHTEIGCDVVFDCVGRPEVAAHLSAVTRVRGTIVLAGLYAAPAAVDLHALTFAEQRLLGSRVYSDSDLREAVSLIESDLLALSRLPLQTYDLSETNAAFAAAAAGRALKITINPQPESAYTG